MDVTKVIEVLEAYFPLSLQEGWDNSGLQISPKDSSIKGILLSLDVGLDTIDEAIDNNCNLIIAHHPLIFSSTKKIYKDFYPYNAIQKAIRHGIGIYAFHTNLDIAINGLNDYICKLLELENVKIIEEYPPLRIGNLKSTMPIEEAVSYIKNKLGAECVKFVKGNSKPIKKIAICTGSCADMVYEIKDLDFDLFLTGDLKHHTAFFAKYSGINMVDATHFHTEKFSKNILYDTLKKEINDIKLIISKKDSIPWFYK